MSIDTPESHLCWKDKRNPDYYAYDDDMPPPRTNCSCDNCFYGRDELALEIIKLTRDNAALRGALEWLIKWNAKEALKCSKP